MPPKKKAKAKSKAETKSKAKNPYGFTREQVIGIYQAVGQAVAGTCADAKQYTGKFFAALDCPTGEITVEVAPGSLVEAQVDYRQRVCAVREIHSANSIVVWHGQTGDVRRKLSSLKDPSGFKLVLPKPKAETKK